MLDAALRLEAGQLLSQIQACTREYPTQTPAQRALTFATMRTAADSLIVLAEDHAPDQRALEVREAGNDITSYVTDLADRAGSTLPGHCGVCGSVLNCVQIGREEQLYYCTVCPTPILASVRSISDALEADIL